MLASRRCHPFPPLAMGGNLGHSHPVMPCTCKSITPDMRNPDSRGGCFARRWQVLRQVLDMLLGVRGNHSAYLDLVSEHRHILNVLPGGVLEPWDPPAPKGTPGDHLLGVAAVIPSAEAGGLMPQTQP